MGKLEKKLYKAISLAEFVILQVIEAFLIYFSIELLSRFNDIYYVTAVFISQIGVFITYLSAIANFEIFKKVRKSHICRLVIQCCQC